LTFFVCINILLRFLRFLDLFNLYILLCESNSESAYDPEGSYEEDLVSRKRKYSKDLDNLEKERKRLNIEKENIDVKNKDLKKNLQIKYTKLAEKEKELSLRKKILESELIKEGSQDSRLKMDYSPDKRGESIKKLNYVTKNLMGINDDKKALDNEKKVLKEQFSDDKSDLSSKVLEYNKNNKRLNNEHDRLCEEYQDLAKLKKRRLEEFKAEEASLSSNIPTSSSNNPSNTSGNISTRSTP
jgi:DNA repair exonuclease SbcCD ATPase subunit